MMKSIVLHNFPMEMLVKMPTIGMTMMPIFRILRISQKVYTSTVVSPFTSCILVASMVNFGRVKFGKPEMELESGFDVELEPPKAYGTELWRGSPSSQM